MLLLLPIAALNAAEKATAKPAKPVKPYPLDVCLASGEALGGDMGEPYVLVENGQEIKLCCKSCLKDFNKGKGTYMKKIADAQKKAK